MVKAAKATKTPVSTKRSTNSDTFAELVRFSRAGDQFHYLWAARRLLQLINPSATLVAVAIEGTSPREVDGAAIAAGEAVIDVTEYDGDERLETTTAVRYLQLKHSTQQADTPWPTNGLKGTLAGFSARYDAIRLDHGDAVAAKLTFEFVTNRPFTTDLLESIEDLAAGDSRRHKRTAQALSSYINLTGESERAFWASVRCRREGHHAVHKADLAQELSGYLAGPDTHGPLHLKDLVVQRVLPDASYDPVIRKMDVLRALGVSPDELFPAPNRMDFDPAAVPRAQEPAIAATIITATAPIVIEATSGVGKSVLATRLGAHMPNGSATVVYDCFGAGDYRQRAHPRHRHKDALVQMANEMAGFGLCDALLPNATADPPGYLRAFLKRLEQAVETVRRNDPGALVTLIVDAADNAEMGATEAGDDRSFARDLIRETLPEGVRLVVLSRPARTHYLHLPVNLHRILLEPFNLAESTAHLHRSFPAASDDDAKEFHRLSSQNPRVQANALAGETDVAAMLRKLGPDPKSVDDTIAAQLDAAVRTVLDTSKSEERAQVEKLCAALSMLRPLVPLDVLSALSGAPISAIRDFVVDFGGGRPLFASGDAVQFRDEPVEDWFRKTYRPTTAQLLDFVDQLKPLAESSTYVAAALPAMLLEVGRLDELIEITLASTFLPTGNVLQRRDVELQRLQFALRASLRAKRYGDAAKLAMRGGGEAAGDSRHLGLLQANTDLAGRLLDTGTVQDLVSRRGFTGKWLGARHAYEAALLSENPQLAAEARSRLRLAQEWLASWMRLPVEERRSQPVEDAEVAALAMADLRVHGALACVQELSRWKPSVVGYRVSSILTRRLIDGGEASLVAALDEGLRDASIAKWALLPALGFLDELRRVGAYPSRELVQFILRRLPRKKRLGEGTVARHRGEVFGLISVVNAIESAAHYGLGTRPRFLALLDAYLPKTPGPAWAHPFGETRVPYLRAYALRGALLGGELDEATLAEESVRKDLTGNKHYGRSEDTRRFVSHVSTVLPWYLLRARWAIDPPNDAAAARAAIAAAHKAATGWNDVRSHERGLIESEVAVLWFGGFAIWPVEDSDVEEFFTWADGSNHSVAPSTSTELGRLAARTDHLKRWAFDLCMRGLSGEHDSSEMVDSKIGAYLAVSRALLALDSREAAAYLERAIEVANRLGDEAYDRWDCLLQLVEYALRSPPNRPDIAYRFGRCGEVVHEYLDKHFDWDATLRGLCGLSPEGGLAVASRWRDRSVGWFDDVLTGAIEAVVTMRAIDPREGAAFVGFDFAWDYPKLLDQALGTSHSDAERRRILAALEPYLRLKVLPAKTWRALEAASARHAVAGSEFGARAIEAEVRLTKLLSSGRKKQDGAELDPEPLTPDHWDGVFKADSLSDANGFAAVLSRTNYSMRRLYDTGAFWREAYARVTPGGEAAFVGLALSHPDLGLMEVDGIISALPAAWRTRHAVRNALKTGLERMLTEHHTYVWHNRMYQRISIPKVAEVVGEPISWAVDILAKAFASNSTPLKAGESFQLASILAMTLSPADALEALDFGLHLIEDPLRPEDGDGPWAPDLVPKPGAPGAAAALLWGCLGAPQAAIRWQGAHAVRLLCALDRSEILDDLVAFAEGRPLGPFVDRRFVFYDRHARMWLLIALARAALDNPLTVARYRDFLLAEACDREPHVLTCQFAHDAVMAVHGAGLGGLSAAELSRLGAVNRSSIPQEKTDPHPTPRVGVPKRDRDSQRFHFAHDMDRYWFDPLSDCFHVSGAFVEDVAEQIVCDDWKVTLTGTWAEDERQKTGLYRDFNRSMTSHGSLPEIDNLDFYFSFHALMTAAGKLLRTHPLHADLDGAKPRFDEWIRRHLLSRRDGRWLSDRRDPIPRDAEDLCSGSGDDWRWSVVADDFVSALHPTERQLTVWGSWSSTRDGTGFEASVSSALVSPTLAPALLRAMQTVPNSRDVWLPWEGADSEIDEGKFKLKGWIEAQDRSRELDEHDPWSGNVGFPPQRPAAFIRDAMAWKTDADCRVWRDGKGEVMWSEVWGSAKDREGELPASGDRLVASREALTTMLKRLDLHLLVEVQLQHTSRRDSWQRRNEDEVEYADPYSRLFLVKSDGSIETA